MMIKITLNAITIKRTSLTEEQDLLLVEELNKISVYYKFHAYFTDKEIRITSDSSTLYYLLYLLTKHFDIELI